MGLNAAAITSRFGVGIEIDYEENSNPSLAGLQGFIDAYRSVHPFDPENLAAERCLTIDLAAGVPSARRNYKPTYPPDSCEGGMGVASLVFEFPVPTEVLRQD